MYLLGIFLFPKVTLIFLVYKCLYLFLKNVYFFKFSLKNGKNIIKLIRKENNNLI